MAVQSTGPIQGIGVTLGSRTDFSDAELIKIAQAADSLGYEALFQSESWGKDAMMVLAMLAGHTKRIKVGSGIITVYSRTPGLVAQSIATLDGISGGRAILGLGTSSPAVIEKWHGVPYKPSLLRTREYVEIIRLALSGQRVDYHGKLFNLERFHMAYKGPRTAIPIWLASLGPRSMELAGEVADGWLPIFLDVSHLSEMWAHIQKGAAASGRSLESFTIAPYVIAAVSRDGDEALELVREHIAFYVGGMGEFYARLFERYGFVDETQRIREAFAKRDYAKASASVTEAMADHVAIFGDERACRARLQRCYDAGIHLPILTMPRKATLAQIHRTIEGLAPARS